jgi:hypothetical protein
VSACGVCGNARRRGAGRRVYVLGPEPGKVRAVIACASCAGRSVTLAVAPLATENGRKALVLDAAEKDVRTVLRGIAKRLRGLARIEGPAQMGLEQAADIVEGAAKNEASRRIGT